MEDFIRDEYEFLGVGGVSDEVFSLIVLALESYRLEIEYRMSEFDEDEQSWRQVRNDISEYVIDEHAHMLVEKILKIDKDIRRHSKPATLIHNVSERVRSSYTVAEIDELRRACTKRYLFGTTNPTPIATASYNSRVLREAVEVMMREFMMAGVTAQDIYAEDKKNDQAQ